MKWQRHRALFACSRFDTYLVQQFPNLSRSSAQLLIKDGYALLNDKKAKPSSRIIENSMITVALEQEPKATEIEAENIPLEILYEDEELLAIVKPAGLVVHPAHGNWSGTLVNALLYHCGKNLGKTFHIGGEIRPGIVHRIDKNTSGILVVAKTDFALQQLATQFKQHSIIRKYYGISWGKIPPSGQWENSIQRDPKHRKRMMITNLGGKKALTKYVRIESYEVASFFEAELFTGRTHQIRVQFSHAGYPLLGDPTYTTAARSARKTKENSWKILQKNNSSILDELEIITNNFQRQMLHAHYLSLKKPSSSELLEFIAPIPPDFAKAQECLRGFKNRLPT